MAQPDPRLLGRDDDVAWRKLTQDRLQAPDLRQQATRVYARKACDSALHLELLELGVGQG